MKNEVWTIRVEAAGDEIVDELLHGVYVLGGTFDEAQRVLVP